MKMNHHLAPPTAGCGRLLENAGDFSFCVVRLFHGAASSPIPRSAFLTPQFPRKSLIYRFLTFCSSVFSRLLCLLAANFFIRVFGVISWLLTSVVSPSRNISPVFHHVSRFVSPPNPLFLKTVQPCAGLYRFVPPPFSFTGPWTSRLPTVLYRPGEGRWTQSKLAIGTWRLEIPGSSDFGLWTL